MRIWMLLCAMACFGRAEAGDLWLTVDQPGPPDAIRLHLPGNWIAESEQPVEIRTADGTVDLRAEAKRLQGRGVGSEARFTVLGDGAPTSVLLSHQQLSGEPASKIWMETKGPKGNGINLTMELAPEQLGAPAQHLDGVLDLDGVQVDLSKALCDQLKRSPPTTVLQTTGPKGGGIVLSTR